MYDVCIHRDKKYTHPSSIYNVPGNPYVQSSSTRNAVDASMTTVRSFSTIEAASFDASSGKPNICRKIYKKDVRECVICTKETFHSMYQNTNINIILTKDDAISLINQSLPLTLILTQFIGYRNDFKIISLG